MIFNISGYNPTDGSVVELIYDNTTNTLSNSDGFIWEVPNPTSRERKATIFSKDIPLKKSKKISLLKIQLGLSCNYSCEYCSQKFVERNQETSRKDIDNFIQKLDTLEFDPEVGLKVEFWGGEPLVYWKTLRPLAEAIRQKFISWGPDKEPRLSMITNGSILTKEICSWLYYMGFSVAISHDGPGQAARGPDPFDDPKQKEIILEFYKVMRRANRISFNYMLNNTNTSRLKVKEWFVNLTGDSNVPLGEGTLVDAYDSDGIASSLTTLKEHFEYRQNAFNEIYSTEGAINNAGIISKIDGFITDVLNHSHSETLGQKCGMDNDGAIAVDLHGNVLTCQNVSALEISKNGESHLGGTLDDYDNVKFTSSTHWSQRKHCSECPVLHICKGSCMFLDGEYWDASCANSYSDGVVFLALAIYRITGKIPMTIKAEGLPLHRQDIWGTVYEHKEPQLKRVIPIKAVVEKTKTVNDIPVYDKSR